MEVHLVEKKFKHKTCAYKLQKKLVRKLGALPYVLENQPEEISLYLVLI